MEFTEAITEARANIARNLATEPWVVASLLREIERLTQQLESSRLPENVTIV